MALIPQNSSYTRAFLLVSTSDHITGLTGQTPVITLYKGASTSSSSSTGAGVKEMTNGWYNIALSSNDTSVLGDLVIHATSTGGDPTDWVDQVVAFNLNDSVRLGLTALPNANAAAAGGLMILGSNNTAAITLGPITASSITSTGTSTITNLTSTGTWTIPNITSTGTWTVTNATSTGVWAIRAITSTGGITADITGNVSGSVGSVTAAVTVGTNNDKTSYTLAVGGIPSGGNASAELNNIADAILDRNMAAGVDSGTNSTAVRTPRQAWRILRNKVSVSTGASSSTGTITVMKEDDATTSWSGGVTLIPSDPLSIVDPT